MGVLPIYTVNCYFHIGAVALTSGFANGKGQIWLDRVSCLGTETRLVDCPANPMGNNNCGHVQDAGVSCTLGRSCRSQSGVYIAYLIACALYFLHRLFVEYYT